ncbi:MAG: hypothetical protein M1828_007642 [Chrysothrix sp. TS-e1954]|nr:MAG: hypothetical protein M1828_007642 [Chrysothrix sp. TS-e1954]
MSKMGVFALEGGDPRLSTDEGKGVFGESSIAYTRPQMRKLHDPSITFEEYTYYARKTRAEEDKHADLERSQPTRGFLSMIIPSKSDKGVTQQQAADLGIDTAAEKRGSVVAKTVNLGNPDARAQISDEEWTNASRALRTASWGAIFYLITTDILGPFGLPFAFASLGWGPGVALFTVFAGMAIYSGFLLWQMFMGLDSYEFPLKSYGDIAYRLYGQWLRILFNVLQGIQLLLNVGQIIISNGEALSQASKFKLCFAICCLVWALAGFVLGQVRTLQKFGWLANAAVWINVICMILTMAGAANSAPNYTATASSAGNGLNGGVSVTANAAGKYPAVYTSAGLPDTSSFVGPLNGAMSAVFSYGGAMVFPEFMSEMKRPRDFLKGMWGAQVFIYLVYMFYGMFMYGYQGQYVVNPSYLGVSKYSIQTAGNVFAMLSALIAAGLYGNIGIKVLYNNIFVELLHAPPLTTKKGKIAWALLIPVYWAIAFVIGAGIPDFIGMTSVVAAFCILHFTYTFPPLMAVMFYSKLNAMRDDEGFDPASGETKRHDSGIKRIMRGFFAKVWYINVFNILYFLGALALAGLGAYAAIENLVDAFASGATNSYTCTSPVE